MVVYREEGSWRSQMFHKIYWAFCNSWSLQCHFWGLTDMKYCKSSWHTTAGTGPREHPSLSTERATRLPFNTAASELVLKMNSSHGRIKWGNTYKHFHLKENMFKVLQTYSKTIYYLLSQSYIAFRTTYRQAI